MGGSGLDAFLGQSLGGAERIGHADAEGDDGDILANAGDARLADGSRVNVIIPPLALKGAPAGRTTLYRMGRDTPSATAFWLCWTDTVHVTRGFDTSDTTERTYYTGSGTPKWTNNNIGLSGGAPYPQVSRELSVPAPTTAPQIAMGTDGTTGTESVNFYVTTFVNELGWESAPSPVSTGLSMKPGAVVNIGNTIALESAPAGNYGINRRRIYRTQTGTNGTAEFFFLREVAIATTVTSDDARALGELLPTEGFLPPPSAGFGIISLWGGMMAMLGGRALYVSEAGYPYAYPLRNQKELKDTPVATAKWAQNLLVLTSGAPVVFNGQDPQSLSDQPPRMAHACLSARSVVGFAHGVVWSSNEGLAYYGDRSVVENDGGITSIHAAAIDHADEMLLRRKI